MSLGVSIYGARVSQTAHAPRKFKTCSLASPFRPSALIYSLPLRFSAAAVLVFFAAAARALVVASDLRHLAADLRDFELHLGLRLQRARSGGRRILAHARELIGVRGRRIVLEQMRGEVREEL